MDSTYIPYPELKSCGYDLTTESGVRFAEMCRRIDTLLEDIQLHFKDVPAPQITLHVARAYDDEWTISPAKGNALRKLDPEERWQDVSKEKIETYQEYFNFSDNEGWRFYLPAFMTQFLLEFPNNGYVAVCSAAKSNDARLQGLSDKQRRCVSEFAQLCDDFEIWSP